MAENNFELRVSEPIPNEANYQLSKEELSAWFDEQYQLLQAGKKQGVTMEFAMLGHAMDFIDFAERATQIELDFEEEGIIIWQKRSQEAASAVICMTFSATMRR